MKKSFQTKESEFAATDHFEMSGVLFLIPQITIESAKKNLQHTCVPKSAVLMGKKLGVQISLLLVSRDLCGKKVH